MRLTVLIVLAFAACVAQTSPGEAACRVASRAVDFGTVELDRDSKSTGRLTVTCDESTGFRVGIEQGGGELWLDGPGRARLAYRLYSDPGYRIPFDSEGVAAATEGEDPARITVYGLVPRQQPVPEGSYQGRLVVTLTF